MDTQGGYTIRSRGKKMTKSKSGYTSSFQVFSGADVVVNIDGQLIGEVQGVEWNRQLANGIGGNKVEGIIQTCVFDKTPLEKYIGKSFDMKLKFHNERGHSKAYLFEDVQLCEQSGGIGTDSVLELIDYTFKAQNFEAFPDYKTLVEDQVAYIKENVESTDRHTKRLVELYKEEIIERLLRGFTLEYQWKINQWKDREAELADIKKKLGGIL